MMPSDVRKARGAALGIASLAGVGCAVSGAPGVPPNFRLCRRRGEERRCRLGGRGGLRSHSHKHKHRGVWQGK